MDAPYNNFPLMNDNCKIIETLHFRVAPNVGTKKEKAAWRTNDSFFLTASFNRLAKLRSGVCSLVVTN